MNSKQAFIQWIKKNDPFLYKIAETRYKLQNPGMSGIADFFTSLVSTVKDVAPAVINMAAQRKVINLQIERAKQGLPPLDTAQYSPTIKVSPELTPETEAAAQRVAIETVKQGIGEMKIPLLAIAGLLGAFLFMSRRR